MSFASDRIEASGDTADLASASSTRRVSCGLIHLGGRADAAVNIEAKFIARYPPI
jgi:hypothetical protein